MQSKLFMKFRAIFGPSNAFNERQKKSKERRKRWETWSLQENETKNTEKNANVQWLKIRTNRDICGVIFSTEFIRKGFNKQFYSVFNFSSRQKNEISSQSLELIHCDAWGQLKTSNCSLRETKKNATKTTSKHTHFFRFITQSIVINIFFNLRCPTLKLTCHNRKRNTLGQYE